MAKPRRTSAALLLVTLLSVLASGDGAGTVQELLRGHGLPAGVLPRTVRSFSLDPTTGLLEARLDGPCYARWRDNPIYFEPVVAGNLSYGALSGVVGLSQEELFLWLPVKGILVADPASGVVLVDIGVARKQLSLSALAEPPDCLPPAEEEGLILKPGSRTLEKQRPEYQR